jgi:hypothetical protein
MILDQSESEIDSKIVKYTKNGVAELGMMGIGFILGATEANATLNASQDYATNISWRLSDTLTNLGVGGIKVPYTIGGTGVVAGTSYTSKSGARKINYTGWLNQGLAAAILGQVYKKLNLPLGRTVESLTWNVGIGYSVGGIFDPPGQGSIITVGNQPQAPRAVPATGTVAGLPERAAVGGVHALASTQW